MKNVRKEKVCGLRYGYLFSNFYSRIPSSRRDSKPIGSNLLFLRNSSRIRIECRLCPWIRDWSVAAALLHNSSVDSNLYCNSIGYCISNRRRRLFVKFLHNNWLDSNRFRSNISNRSDHKLRNIFESLFHGRLGRNHRSTIQENLLPKADRLCEKLTSFYNKIFS